MTSQLVCRPEQQLPVGVLRVSGTLDQVTGDALRQAVRRGMAVQPVKLLLDVTRLHIGDPMALTVFSSVVCETNEWPDVPIVLCGANRRTAEILATAPDCAGLHYAADCEAALDAARSEPPPDRITARLRPVPDACRQVRQLVAQACSSWQRSDLTATATLIATELVANVVRHAHTTMEFTLARRRDGRLSMTVRDGSRRMPKPADPGVKDAGGRGLRLVRDMSEAWGVLPISDGKVVWSRLSAA